MSRLTFCKNGWLVELRIYVASAVLQPYRDLEAGDNQSLKFKWRSRRGIELRPLAPQAKSLNTRPPPLPFAKVKHFVFTIHRPILSSCYNKAEKSAKWEENLWYAHIDILFCFNWRFHRLHMYVYCFLFPWVNNNILNWKKNVKTDWFCPVRFFFYELPKIFFF